MAIKEYKLGDICHFKTGIDPIKSEMNGDIPFIKLGNTSGFEIDYKNSEKITSSRKEKAKLNDLLLCWSCSVGKSFIVKQTCFYSTAFYKLERKDNVYLNKYLHYSFIKNEKQINKLAVGSVLKKANMNILGNYILNLPDLQTQQEIINIIEPFEKLIEKYNDKKMYLIKILNYFYELNKNENKKIKLLDFSLLNNKKYNNQKFYVETSNINDNYEMCGNKEIINKKPSRANLSVINNSLIFSKLKGSNKLFIIYDESLCKYVYSTGFYNIYSKENMNWYLFGFLNSYDFINQKNQNSNGTLMEGITINGLSEITLNSPKQNLNLNSCLELLSKINKINEKLKIIIQNLIETYIV